MQHIPFFHLLILVISITKNNNVVNIDNIDKNIFLCNNLVVNKRKSMIWSSSYYRVIVERNGLVKHFITSNNEWTNKSFLESSMGKRVSSVKKERI
jgi:hypothetical protein